jgi:hypothetical protein
VAGAGGAVAAGVVPDAGVTGVVFGVVGVATPKGERRLGAGKAPQPVGPSFSL